MDKNRANNMGMGPNHQDVPKGTDILQYLKGDLQLSRQTAWEGRCGMPAPGDGVSGVLAGGGSIYLRQESFLVGELGDGLCRRSSGDKRDPGCQRRLTLLTVSGMLLFFY